MVNTASNKHFNESARNWDTRPTSIQLQPLPTKLLSKLQLSITDKVLDFGTGTGLLATAIAPHVQQVTALDMSSNMLAVLNEKGIPNIKTLEKDIFTGLPEQYDCIVSSMAMHHVADTQRLFQSFADALVVGGQIALIDLFKEDGTFHGDNKAKGVQHFGFDPSELTQIAQQAGFRHINFCEIHQLTRDNGRTYPMFLMQGIKEG
ncbi:class I SAM-dependent DNA methyltransferase [Pelistega europaea]|uniref:Methyltransferase domain-containing protein n=1 Tax=Pelistega europaea TaxID=106147 RepID=A0A7Y4P400_9BURK|nr:class I SAM-dependent methyltransferase [Pelistega europaea]NOL49572.1 methyltransferase domain-containing protein [Pelistega europaea]